jgi:hypothetical protein
VTECLEGDARYDRTMHNPGTFSSSEPPPREVFKEKPVSDEALFASGA